MSSDSDCEVKNHINKTKEYINNLKARSGCVVHFVMKNAPTTDVELLSDPDVLMIYVFHDEEYKQVTVWSKPSGFIKVTPLECII